jgi:Ca2+-transporting ATPase
LNDLAELIAKLGTAAGLILFTALLIRFLVQLGTKEPVRTASQMGLAFVNILIISVTLIVVAVPEGMHNINSLSGFIVDALGKVCRWL